MPETNDRLLTALLREAGTETIDRSGEFRTRQEILTAMAWNYLLEGEISLPNGTKLTASPREWINALKWLFAQIDGKPPRERTSAPAQETEARPRRFSTPYRRVVEDDPDESDFDEDSDEDEDEAPDFAPAYLTGPIRADEDPAAPAAQPELSLDRDADAIQPDAEPSSAAPADLPPSVPPRRPTMAERLFPQSANAAPRPRDPSRPSIHRIFSDGSSVELDRDEYDRRCAESRRNGSRLIIGGDDSGFYRARW